MSGLVSILGLHKDELVIEVFDHPSSSFVLITRIAPGSPIPEEFTYVGSYQRRAVFVRVGFIPSGS